MFLPDAVLKDILRDIFGTSCEKGLIHAAARKFDVKCARKHWRILEKRHDISTPKIFKWFGLHVAPIIHDNINTVAVLVHTPPRHSQTEVYLVSGN